MRPASFSAGVSQIKRSLFSFSCLAGILRDPSSATPSGPRLFESLNGLLCQLLVCCVDEDLDHGVTT
jgi:hypothetical protein